MNKELYEAVVDLTEIFDNCTVNGEEVWCFKLIKNIIDGKTLIETVSENRKNLAQMQINDSLEWIQSLGVTIKFKEEILELIN